MKNFLRKIKRTLFWFLIAFVAIVIIVLIFSIPTVSKPETITYGASFSKYHSDELGLNWKETYEAILTDLNVEHFRLSAHWPMVEPNDDEFNFVELDYQVRRAREENATVILAVGYRLPGWPECHVPHWASELSKDEQQKEVEEYMTTVVNRYKEEPHIEYWQVENEAFLWHFASDFCADLDVDFLEGEIDLVKDLDPDTPVLITDSGEFGTWLKAHSRGDTFGTTMYLYIWSHGLGKIRYPIRPGFFSFKRNMVRIFDWDKPLILIELGLEPWLLTPIVDAPLELQMQRMGMDKFKETVEFARRTRFDKQYLWGVEWWYWLKKNHNDERFWEEGRALFGSDS